MATIETDIETDIVNRFLSSRKNKEGLVPTIELGYSHLMAAARKGLLPCGHVKSGLEAARNLWGHSREAKEFVGAMCDHYLGMGEGESPQPERLAQMVRWFHSNHRDSGDSFADAIQRKLNVKVARTGDRCGDVHGCNLYAALRYPDLSLVDRQLLLNWFLETPLPETIIDCLPADFKSLLCFHAFCRIALFQFQQPWYAPDPSFYAKELSNMSICHQIGAMWFSPIVFLRHWAMRDDVRLPIKLLLLPLMSLLVFTLLVQTYTVMQNVVVVAYIGEAVLSTMAWVITCGTFQFSPLRNIINRQWFLTDNPEELGGKHGQRRWMMGAFLLGGLVSLIVPIADTLTTALTLLVTALVQCVAAVSAKRSPTLTADAAIQRLPRPRDTAPGRYPASCFSTLFYRQKDTTAAARVVGTAADVVTVATPVMA